MGFTLPSHISTVLKDLKKLSTEYKEARSKMDNDRFLGSIRPATNNLKRQQATEFLENLAEWISTNKMVYKDLDKRFTDSDYSDEVAPFLKRAISGAMLLELINLYGSDGSIRNDSALGGLLLNQFGIKHFSEAPKDKIIECLKDFQDVLDVIYQSHEKDPLPWLNTAKHLAVGFKIEEELKSLVPSALHS